MNRNRLLAHGISRVPGLKRVPIFKLLALAEVAILAKAHYGRLTQPERKRLFELIKTSRGRQGNLAQSERDELAGLVNKMEPRLFAGSAVSSLSPIPLPKRFTHGPKSAREQREREQQRAA